MMRRSSMGRPSVAGLLALAAALAVAGCSRQPTPSSQAPAAESAAPAVQPATEQVNDGHGGVQVGRPAPDFTATTYDGKPVTLSALRGKPVVVYFYPKDETPGCTKEACALRDAWTKFEGKHVGIIGVSRDTEESHREFVKKHELPFPLSSDPDGTIAKAYGVKSTLGMTERVSFLVGKDGKVFKVWPKVDPAIHADEVLAAADSLPQ
jgi:peroxiredoxin Q/BCP